MNFKEKGATLTPIIVEFLQHTLLGHSLKPAPGEKW